MLADRVRAVQDRVGEACARAGRTTSSVTVVAVSKGQPLARVREIAEMGQKVFGENKLQEAATKIEALSVDLEWHFIGRLQTNKLIRISERFGVIETLDSLKQVEILGRREAETMVLVEVNIAEEPQKAGVLPAEVEDFVRTVLQYPQIHFRGLMTVGPIVNDPELMRPYFATLRGLNDKVGGEWLSMGMSSDFEVAIMEGSTHVRIGTALFGERSV